MREELAGAFMLLTRFPVGALAAPPDVARCVWAYPVAGAAVGAVGAAAYALLHWLGASPALAAVWALAATALATGALHEDGLADMADGFGGGASVARKLEIMRDSRVGSYGVLALLLAAGMRIAAVASVAGPLKVSAGLIAAGALSRGSMALLLLTLAPARTDGLAAGLGARAPRRALLALGLAVLVASVVLPPAAACVSVLAGLAAAASVASLARAQIGGYTGDVLGACAVCVECAVLSGLAVL